MKRTIAATIFTGLTTFVMSSASRVEAADADAGKEIRIVIRANPGGNYDIYSRILLQHMVQHMPGHPVAVPINMPGASGVAALNYVAKVAPADGTYLTMVTPSFPMDQTLHMNDNLHFDFKALNWIGNLSDSNTFVVTAKNSSTKTFALTQTRTTTLGVPSEDDVTALMALLMNKMIDTRFKLIVGYASGPEMTLAMRRGEIDGRGTSDPQTLLASDAGRTVRDEFNFLVQMGLKSDPTYPDVPLLTDLAKNKDQKAAFDFLSKAAAIARPIATGPGVSADRVQVLRTAFDATMKDPSFLADAAKAGLQIHPMSGAELQTLVSDIVGTSPDVLTYIKKSLKAE
jgi:tripartite-type tricarboxylate transporter receptor subunit TctC